MEEKNRFTYKCCFQVLLNNTVVVRCQTERGSEFLPNPCSSSWHQPCEHSQEVDRAHGVQATPRNHSIRTVVPSLSPRLAPTNPRGTCELATVCGMSGMRRNPSLIRDQEPRAQLSVAECALLLTRLMSQWDRLEIVTTGVCGMQQTRNFLTAATSGSKALTGIE